MMNDNANINTLIDEVVTALEKLEDTSCPEMVPIWLDGTRLARRDLPSDAQPTLGFTPSERYLRLGRSGQNKWRAVACWRHAVLWTGALDSVDPDFARAVTAIFFTPFPSNKPPYAWSGKPSASPNAPEFSSVTDLKNWGKEGAWQSVKAVRDELRQERAVTLSDELRHALLKTGCRDTVRDALKLRDHPKWKPL